MKRVLTDFLNWLNGAGTFTLMYLSVNDQLPAPAEALMSKLHEPWQTIARIMVPIAWGTLVQFAKNQSNKKAAGAANGS